tara:strand:- start:361 stop:861 length:501 start_codon:yes stop_codon:yes gene_type:complete
MENSARSNNIVLFVLSTILAIISLFLFFVKKDMRYKWIFIGQSIFAISLLIIILTDKNPHRKRRARRPRSRFKGNIVIFVISTILAIISSFLFFVKKDMRYKWNFIGQSMFAITFLMIILTDKNYYVGIVKRKPIPQDVVNDATETFRTMDKGKWFDVDKDSRHKF